MNFTNLEVDWMQQWYGAQKSIHTLVNKYNNQLRKINPNVWLASFLIDAVPLEELTRLSKQYSKVYILTEQSGFTTPNNVEVHTLPIDYYGCYYISNIPVNNNIQKEFNCFINRMDPIRQSWFYLLYDRNLLDHGYVSFNCYLRDGLYYPGKSWQEVFDQYHQTYLSSFDNIKSAISSLIPFKNFVDNNDLCSIILNTKFSIVIETYFERTDCKVFSEKIFRSLQLPRPWLLFGATGSVEKLRQLGFDVYDDIVDHSYDHFDTTECCVSRQEAILEQSKKMLNLNITPNMLARLEKGATQNRLLLKHWHDQWEKTCYNHIHQIFEIACR